MNKAANFARLDVLTLKPYYKTYLLLLLMMLVMTYISKSAVILCFYVLVGLAMTVSYPFSIGEKNGLDTLYATLSINKKSIVIGRYFFAICLELFGILLILIMSTVFTPLMGVGFDVNETMFSICLGSLLFAFMVSVQFPIYFKNGYDKAKYVAYMPIVLIYVGVLAMAKVTEAIGDLDIAKMFTDIIDANTALLYVSPVLLGAVLLTISCVISIRIYTKRDI